MRFALITLALICLAGCQPQEVDRDKEPEKRTIKRVDWPETHFNEKDSSEMVFVRFGRLRRGVDLGRFTWEETAHPSINAYIHDQPKSKSELVSSFYIDRYEVTNAQYAKFVEETGWVTEREKRGYKETWRDPYGTGQQPEDFDRLPVVRVGWEDAGRYAKWAGKRLPLEREWELAAVGTEDDRIFPWGDIFQREILNTKSTRDGFEFLAPVGTFPQSASPCGALDMAGNAWEWVTKGLVPQDYSWSEPDGGRKYRSFKGGSCEELHPLFFAPRFYFGDDVNIIFNGLVGFRCALDSSQVEQVEIIEEYTPTPTVLEDE